MEYKFEESQKYAFAIEFDSQEDFDCFCDEVRLARAQYADALSAYAEPADSVSDFLNKIMERGKHYRTSDGKPMAFLYKSEAACYVVDSMQVLFSYCTLVDIYEVLGEQQQDDFADAAKTFAGLLDDHDAVLDADGEIIDGAYEVINAQADYIDMLEKKIAELSEHALEQTELIECRDKIHEARIRHAEALESQISIIRSICKTQSDET